MCIPKRLCRQRFQRLRLLVWLCSCILCNQLRPLTIAATAIASTVTASTLTSTLASTQAAALAPAALAAPPPAPNKAGLVFWGAESDAGIGTGF